MSWQAALSSADLRKEIEKGSVRVERKTRKPGQTSRHLPPFVALNRTPGPGVASHVRASVELKVEPPKAEPVAVDVEEIARRVRDELLGDVRATVSDEISRALASMPQSLDATQMSAVLEGVLRKVLPAGGAAAPVASSAPRARASAPADEPLYMPTNIVDKDAKGKVVLESQSSEEIGDLDDAAAALRELKRQRGKTHGNQENSDE